jgi:hypothetical protein
MTARDGNSEELGYHAGLPELRKTLRRMKTLLLVVSGIAALAGGCASPEAGAPKEEVDRVYNTGSNIPRKQRAGPADGSGAPQVTAPKTSSPGSGS